MGDQAGCLVGYRLSVDCVCGTREPVMNNRKSTHPHRHQQQTEGRIHLDPTQQAGVCTCVCVLKEREGVCVRVSMWGRVSKNTSPSQGVAHGVQPLDADTTTNKQPREDRAGHWCGGQRDEEGREGGRGEGAPHRNTQKHTHTRTRTLWSMCGEFQDQKNTHKRVTKREKDMRYSGGEQICSEWSAGGSLGDWGGASCQ